MKNLNIKLIETLKPSEALEALNRLTNLTWSEYPHSLLPNGMVIHGNNFKYTQTSHTISKF